MKKRLNISNPIKASVFALALGVSGFVLSPSASAAGQTCTWTGAGGNKNFSTAGNWSGCGGAAPTAGDTIRFESGASEDTTLINDLNVALGGVVTKAINYREGDRSTYTIDKLELAPGAALTFEKSNSCDISYTNYIVSNNVTSTGNVRDDGVLQIFASKYNIGGSLTLSNNMGTFSPSEQSAVDSLVFAAPVLRTTATNCGGMGGVGGTLGIAKVSYNSLVVQKGAFALLAGDFSKPITFGGGEGSNPYVNFASKSDTNGLVESTANWTSPITLLSDAGVYVGQKTTVNFTGTISGSGFKLVKNPASNGVFNNNPTSNNSDSETGTIVNKPKTTKLEDKTDKYVTVVDKETAILTGVRESIDVQDGGLLKGTGSVTYGLYVYEGGVVAPGMSPGCLTVGQYLVMNGSYKFELGGKKACEGYDQIIVKASDYSGLTPVVINKDTATLDIYSFGNFVQAKGDEFIIIDNQTDKPVEGTFKDLPEGAEVKAGNAVFTISYKGGDGNDVVLIAQNNLAAPKVPNTGFAIISSNPIIVTVAAVIGAVALGFMLKRASLRK